MKRQRTTLRGFYVARVGYCAECLQLYGLKHRFNPVLLTHDWPPFCRMVCKGSNRAPAEAVGYESS